MGAVSVAVRKTTYTSGGKVVVADVTFSGTYAAGGDTYTNAQFGAQTVDAIVDGGSVGSATTGYVLSPDLTGRKLRLLAGSAAGSPLAETATANQAATVSRVLVFADNPYI